MERFIAVLNSQKGQESLGDMMQLFILHAFAYEYALPVSTHSIGSIIESDRTHVAFTEQGVHTHPVIFLTEGESFEGVLRDETLSRLPLFPSIGVVNGNTDIWGGIGMIISGTETTGFYGLAYDCDKILQEGRELYGKVGGLEGIVKGYNKGAFRLFKIVDLTPKAEIKTIFVSGVKKYSAAEVSIEEFIRVWHSLKDNVAEIRSNIEGRYAALPEVRKHEHEEYIRNRTINLIKQRRAQKQNPDRILFSWGQAIIEGRFDEAMEILKDVDGRFLGGELQLLRMDEDEKIRHNVEEFMSRNLGWLEEKCRQDWFPGIAYIPLDVLQATAVDTKIPSHTTRVCQ